jgi:hypothetical protein
MQKTSKTILAIAALLTVSATAMAAPSHRVHRMDARDAATIHQQRARTQMQYDPAANAFEPYFGGAGESLFDRAKGDVSGW